MVRDRGEVAGQQRLDVGEPRRGPGPASHRRFDAPRPHRTCGYTAIGCVQRHDFPAPSLEAKGGNDSRDVLIEPLANLVCGKLLAGGQQGNADRGDDLARREGRLAIAGNEGFDRQHTLARARGERDRGIKRDQAGNGVANRRGGREIAGNRSEVANLPRADAPDEGTKGWKVLIEMGQGFGVGDRADDIDRVALRLDPPQLRDTLERDHGRQRLAVLAHAQPKIGSAREQDRVGEFHHGRKQRIEGARHETGLRAVTIVSASRERRQRIGQSGQVGNEAVGRPVRDAAARCHDRAIAGAAAKVSSERFMHECVVRGLAAVVESKHRHHESRRAKSALSSVGIDKRLLHRMQGAVRRRQALDREDRAIVDLRQHHQA